jgi:hypothetical protein
MNHDSSKMRSAVEERCGSGARVTRPANDESQTGKARPPARNWAWAHGGESYDWMDWHSPSATAGLSH